METRAERPWTALRESRFGCLGGALDELQASRHWIRTRLLPSRCERFTRPTTDECSSSISAVSAVFTDTLASMTKHSCRAFADLGLTTDTGT